MCFKRWANLVSNLDFERLSVIEVMQAHIRIHTNPYRSSSQMSDDMFVANVGAVHASLTWPFAQAQLMTRILAVGGGHLASQVISEPGGHRLVTTSHFIVLVVDTGSTAVTAPSFYLTMMISTCVSRAGVH